MGSTFEEESVQIYIGPAQKIYLNGSKSGRVQDTMATTKLGTSVGIGTLAFGEAAYLISQNTTIHTIEVTIQKEVNTPKVNPDQRAVVEYGHNRNESTLNAGSTFYSIKVEPLLKDPPMRVWNVNSLKKILRAEGYGEYIEGDKYTNIRIEFDPAHATDLSVGYLHYNSDGDLTIIPKMYPGDKVEIVNNIPGPFLSYSGIDEVKYDITTAYLTSQYLNEYALTNITKILQKNE
jgi:hypothetical protein